MADAGAVFAIIWICLFFPLAIPGVVWFWKRRDIQPIKARAPKLVLAADIILLCYALLLCVNRIAENDFPCWLNMWTGYLGTLLLLNVYIVRCWVLYFSFKLTEQRLRDKMDLNNWFVKNRRLKRISVVWKYMLVTILFLLPPMILSGDDEVTESNDNECDRKWGDPVLACIVALYVVVFLSLGWNLRQVFDNFLIKQELRLTGLVAIVAVIPWVIFNNESSAEEVNEDDFPLSTLFVLLAVAVALGASTFYPLYRSLYPAEGLLEITENTELATLEGFVRTSQGFASFRTFLTSEFSVENLQFWADVEEFRAVKAKETKEGKKELGHLARGIYSKYIMENAPFEINLPSNIVQSLQAGLRQEYGDVHRDTAASSVELLERHHEEKEEKEEDEKKHSVKTLFDEAQKNIYSLMQSDSYTRFKATEAYARVLSDLQKIQKEKEALQEVGVV